MSRYALGLLYESDLELTTLVPRDQQGTAVINEKVYLDGLKLSYIDSGDIKVGLTNNRSKRTIDRTIRSDYGSALGSLQSVSTLPQTDQVYTETGRRLCLARGRAEDISVNIKSESVVPVRIVGISQLGSII